MSTTHWHYQGQVTVLKARAPKRSSSDKPGRIRRIKRRAIGGDRVFTTEDIAWLRR